jgi:hypothetical protein
MFVDEGGKRKTICVTRLQKIANNQQESFDRGFLSFGQYSVSISFLCVISYFLFDSTYSPIFIISFSPSAHGSIIVHRRVLLGIDRLVKTTHSKLLLLIRTS